MKKLFLYLFLGLLLSGNAFADLNYEPIGKTYVIEDQILIVSNNFTLQYGTLISTDANMPDLSCL